MEYFDYSLKLYNQIEQTDFSKLSLPSDNPMRAIIPLLLENFSHDKFINLYRKETDKIIDEDLPIFNNDPEEKNKLKSIYYYDKSINTYSWMYLFWIWHNNIDISKEDLQSLLKAVFMGMMGYRLVDIYTDDKNPESEYLFIGNYLTRLFEQIFNDVFKSKNTFDIINHYTLKYNEIEYLEKRNLWKSSPFSWDNASEIGLKTSPLLSLFHVVFKECKLNEEKSEDLIKALQNALAVNQIVDDISDAASDLSIGRETLVMKGFFNKYGINNSWSDKNIAEFLSQDRYINICKNIFGLFEESVALAQKHDDMIFQFFLELVNQVFLKNFEITPIDN